MALTNYKRIQNLDVTQSQYKQILSLMRELNLSRARLLRLLLSIALSDIEQVKEHARNPTMFD